MFTEVQVRNNILVSDNLDVWFDAKPVPFVDGRNRDQYIDTSHIGELSDIESRYYRFNADEIIDLYRRYGCQGQPKLFSKLFGIDASIMDAHIQWEAPPDDLGLPSSYATISAGWTETSHYKGWTPEGWAEVARWHNGHGICPVQVGTEDEEGIQGALSARSLNMRQQTGVIFGSTLHLGCDGFFSHVSSAADIPTVVLWGPTPHEVWGHPGQVAVISPIARTIWWTHYHWAHDPACQEIMRAIGPDAVIDGIGRALEARDA
jgi:ADP-heptose:LPS heptosyltransferase